MSVPFQAHTNTVVQPCEKLFWRALPLERRTGSVIFERLFQSQRSGQAGSADGGLADGGIATDRIATLLESPYPLPIDSLPEAATEMARFSICAGPPRIVEGRSQLWTPTIGEVIPLFQTLGQHLKITQYEPESSSIQDLPFTGGWLGWLGYDCAWEIERLPWLKDDALPFPVAFWYEPAEFAVLDHYAQTLWLAADSEAGLSQMEFRLDSGHNSPTLRNQIPTEPIPSAYGLTFETQQSDFEQAVIRAKAHIRAGDVFQVNHSLRFRAYTTLESWHVYKALHTVNPSPFASYWQTPWGSVVSCSPERLVHLKGRSAQSRPIAGTRPRGRSLVEDNAIASELSSDIKENAEHIMLVDLERNDLGRVCEWGSVRVAELMTIERYSHVMHLVSNVVGRLDPKISDGAAAAKLIAALFPGGTITGCPKVRCMEIIETLEPVRRSLFYGSCGYFDRRGHLDLNILIRTLLMAPSNRLNQQDDESIVWGQVGAGIVADSQPEKEWYESLQKAKAQLIALGLMD